MIGKQADRVTWRIDGRISANFPPDRARSAQRMYTKYPTSVVATRMATHSSSLEKRESAKTEATVPGATRFP
jgi:hypothetical protein